MASYAGVKANGYNDLHANVAWCSPSSVTSGLLLPAFLSFSTYLTCPRSLSLWAVSFRKVQTFVQGYYRSKRVFNKYVLSE